jgi:hypothetical protein
MLNGPTNAEEHSFGDAVDDPGPSESGAICAPANGTTLNACIIAFECIGAVSILPDPTALLRAAPDVEPAGRRLRRLHIAAPLPQSSTFAAVIGCKSVAENGMKGRVEHAAPPLVGPASSPCELWVTPGVCCVSSTAAAAGEAPPPALRDDSLSCSAAADDDNDCNAPSTVSHAMPAGPHCDIVSIPVAEHEAFAISPPRPSTVTAPADSPRQHKQKRARWPEPVRRRGTGPLPSRSGAASSALLAGVKVAPITYSRNVERCNPSIAESMNEDAKASGYIQSPSAASAESVAALVSLTGVSSHMNPPGVDLNHSPASHVSALTSVSATFTCPSLPSLPRRAPSLTDSPSSSVTEVAVHPPGPAAVEISGTSAAIVSPADCTSSASDRESSVPEVTVPTACGLSLTSDSDAELSSPKSETASRAKVQKSFTRVLPEGRPQHVDVGTVNKRVRAGAGRVPTTADALVTKEPTWYAMDAPPPTPPTAFVAHEEIRGRPGLSSDCNDGTTREEVPLFRRQYGKKAAVGVAPAAAATSGIARARRAVIPPIYATESRACSSAAPNRLGTLDSSNEAAPNWPHEAADEPDVSETNTPAPRGNQARSGGLFKGEVVVGERLVDSRAGISAPQVTKALHSRSDVRISALGDSRVSAVAVRYPPTAATGKRHRSNSSPSTATTHGPQLTIAKIGPSGSSRAQSAVHAALATLSSGPSATPTALQRHRKAVRFLQPLDACEPKGQSKPASDASSHKIRRRPGALAAPTDTDHTDTCGGDEGATSDELPM